MEFQLPELGEGVYEAEFVQWLVNPGDVVKSGQNLLQVMTDKAVMDVPSPFVGTIGELRAKPGQIVKIGEVVLTYTLVGQPAVVASAVREGQAPAASPAPTPPRRNGNGQATPLPFTRTTVKAAPSVRQMARKLGIDLANVRGTGPDGRILIDDLTGHVQAAAARAEKKPAPEPLSDFGKPGTRMKLVGLRRQVAEHMVRAAQTIPHYSYVDECDVTDLVRLRESLREHFAKQGAKLTYLAFFVKALVAALKEVPLANSSLDEQAGEIVLHDRYHIGIAVATSGGLIVPVIHDADRKDLARIAREIEQLSGAARTGKIRREDLKGGTFTLTSVGNIGGLFSAPVINHPEVGILGIGKVVRRPVFDARDKVKPADVVYLSLSFDHRVVDGAVCASFCNAVIKHLQNPALLLLPSEPRP
jgi:pyruvate dehydrogenase E2 component (dihydrolipoamide acetyltransferase)/2-oxoisovalerate dehydrogenase E2 component (dihydrolipoyl transacylase)